jgi:hypothetical protein
MLGVDSDRPSSATPTWFVNELAYAGRENLDAAHPARYDSKEDAGATSEVAPSRLVRLGIEDS